MTAQEFVDLLIKNILNPLLYVLFSIALIVFAWGIVEFLWGKAKGVDDRERKGQQHLLWGLVGLFIMVTAASLIGLVVNTFFPGSWPPKQIDSSAVYPN
jgi:nitrogen fixation-related uncharacterized protein